jgi:hypothetical protein
VYAILRGGEGGDPGREGTLGAHSALCTGSAVASLCAVGLVLPFLKGVRTNYARFRCAKRNGACTRQQMQFVSTAHCLPFLFLVPGDTGKLKDTEKETRLSLTGGKPILARSAR